MSTRTALTIVDQDALSEKGPATKTEENSDVTNGNKLAIGPGVVLVARNSTGVAKTVTYTYDERGSAGRTFVVNLAANELAILGPFDPALAVHAADVENGTHVWPTASGVAGDVKFRATRLPLR